MTDPYNNKAAAQIAHRDDDLKARAFAKQLAVDHYSVQGNAAKWELYGELLMRDLRDLCGVVKYHAERADSCEVCQQYATRARQLLDGIEE